MSTRAQRRSRHERGYTVVEVMSAMTLFAIGAAGVISMQRATIQGGDDARRMDIATNIANEWAFRLQRDAAFWTQPNSTVSTSNLGGNTKWLRNAPTSATGDSGWLLPPPDAVNYFGTSGAFDLFGRDLATPGANNHIFCAQHRLSWITYPGGGASSARPLLKAEVRVFWRRLDEAPVGDCATVATTDPADPATKNKFHFVYLTTAVRPASDSQ